MPTELLFGAYHFLHEGADAKQTDSFDFTADSRETEIAMLLPAVQTAPEATAGRTHHDNWRENEAAVVDKEWTDMLTNDPGVTLSGDAGDFVF